MRKILIITILFLMIRSVPVVAGSYSRSSKTNGTCIVKGCNSVASGKSIYCSKHKCTMNGCINYRMGDKYCAYHNNKNNRKTSYGGSYSSGSRRSSNSSSTRKRSYGSRSSFDPDDHDIEAYYDDNRDEYDDYDDAYDGFLDDDDAWDDY